MVSDRSLQIELRRQNGSPRKAAPTCEMEESILPAVELIERMTLAFPARGAEIKRRKRQPSSAGIRSARTRRQSIPLRKTNAHASILGFHRAIIRSRFKRRKSLGLRITFLALRLTVNLFEFGFGRFVSHLSPFARPHQSIVTRSNFARLSAELCPPLFCLPFL